MLTAQDIYDALKESDPDHNLWMDSPPTDMSQVTIDGIVDLSKLAEILNAKMEQKE